MIPICKLPLDVFFYDFSSWSSSHGLSPIDCLPGSRALSVSLTWPLRAKIWCNLEQGWTFTFADWIAYSLGSYVWVGCVVVMVGVSVWHVSYTMRRFVQEAQELRRWKMQGVRTHWTLSDGSTYPFILSSQFQGSACVGGVWASTLFFSASCFEKLLPSQIEAIIAHEREHVRFQDGAVRFVLELLAAVFWWIPTYRLRQAIYADQEIGADAMCSRYGVDRVDLASAICTCARHLSTKALHVVSCGSKARLTQQRVALLLDASRVRTRCLWRGALAMGVCTLLVLCGKFWIF